ncbi:MAG: hypothetical protein A3G58_00810 [Candidatus Colwellbacteria bacterium RIFCSPLOWO2_12_FULL_46_17]|uniref:EamA domain-containing protein n=1 Tax=Candidatus Colwellbacteria bacterium RIFCSPLOWO2_12_FULL_46_17 TaxID=1797695 RepID=A0A1G1ZBU6_9BACT|nr:MAG: hypothetical protein A3G58_00810 [Candidatus Colwellbacteria bacterium RIFCSPLOWO2_12_FULL_46_17]
MNWLVLSIISVVMLSVSNLLRRVLMKDEKSDVMAYSFVFQILCALLVGLFAFAYDFVAPPIREFPLNFALTGVLYAAGTILLFKAYKTTEASRVTILTSSSALWVIITAIIFLGESFTLLKAVGVTLTLVGVILVSIKPKTGTLFSRGDLYALAGAAVYGVAFTNDAFILQSANALSYTSLAFFLPGLLILLIRPSLVKNLKLFLRPSVLLKMTTFSIFYSISAVTVYLAYQKGGDAAQLGSISQSVVVLTVLLAAIFLGERENLIKKSVAAMLATIGVLLLR